MTDADDRLDDDDSIEDVLPSLPLVFDEAIRRIVSSETFSSSFSESESSRFKSLLSRLRDFISTTHSSYSTAIEPSREEKMAILIGSSSSSSASLEKISQRRRREYMVEAVHCADWVRLHLNFFVENSRLFASLGFSYDLFFAFCHTAVSLWRSEGESAGEDLRANLADGIEDIFKTLPLLWKIDFLEALLETEDSTLRQEPGQRQLHQGDVQLSTELQDQPQQQQQHQSHSEKKRIIRAFLHPESSRDRGRFLNSSTLVFNRLVDSSSTSSSSSSKEFGATLHGILDLCLLDASAAAESLFKQALSSNEKSAAVLHIVDKLPFIIRVRRNESGLSKSSSSSSSFSTTITVFQQTLLRAFESHSTQTPKERDHLKKFVSDALGAFQPRWRHDTKLPFYDVARWIVDRLFLLPISVDASGDDVASDEAFEAAVDLLDSFLTNRPRRKWLTLVSDGYALVSGLLLRLERSLNSDRGRINDSNDRNNDSSNGNKSRPSSEPNLPLFLASSLGSVLQDGESFDWFLSFLIQRFDWPTTLAFLGETAEMASKAPKLTAATGSDGEGDSRVAPSLVDAIERLWRQVVFSKGSGGCGGGVSTGGGTIDFGGWTDLLMATVIYVPEVCNVTSLGFKNYVKTAYIFGRINLVLFVRTSIVNPYCSQLETHK